MRMIGSTFPPVGDRPELSMAEALRIYFTILFGVAVSLIAYYILFPGHMP